MSDMKASAIGVLLLFLLSSTSSLQADEATPVDDASSAPSTDVGSPETDAIRQCIEAYTNAYNAHDAQALADLWAEDAEYLNQETGETLQGRATIAAMFQTMFDEGDADHLEVAVKSIRLITPDVALEDGEATLVSADGEGSHSTYTAVHVKKDGAWHLTSVRETAQPSEPAAQLKQDNPLDRLSWMVGEWVDHDEHNTVHTSCNWAKNHRFLTSNFEVSIDGEVALEGTQVIGWDPVLQTVRSWTFDSEGGFGEGIWSESDNQWTVDNRSTQADGSTAKSTNVYTLLDGNAFTWKSVARQVDGELQPDIEEVPVHRQ